VRLVELLTSLVVSLQPQLVPASHGEPGLEAHPDDVRDIQERSRPAVEDFFVVLVKNGIVT